MIIALRHVLAGIGAAAPEELPPVPYASVSRWNGDGDRLRLAAWGDTAPPDLAGRRGRNEAHMNDHSPADSILARVGPVPDGPHAHQVYEAALTDRSLITR
ncbi:hypothetical protein J2S54_006803 [Streptomyces sp. DSM 42143]|uniref:hypothetical protein n=1 Tax=Streptomyces TaxID=1883 RepID=UPI00278446B0|nr:MULTISPECIES: hypothetical protein [Streptomyces]MDQ0389983.1 hypothetical protein [Streptomyces sp. DSM 42143]